MKSLFLIISSSPLTNVNTSLFLAIILSLSLLLLFLCYLLADLIGKLAQAKARFQNFYDDAPCGYFSLDQAGNIIAINNTALDWLGHGSDQLIGKQKIFDLLTPESEALLRENLPQVIEQGCMKELECQMVRQDGTILSLLWRAIAIKDNQGNLLAIRSVLLNLGEYKLAEEVLKQQKEMLETMFDNIPVMLGFADATGRLQFANRELKNVLGWSLAELRNHELWSQCYPDSGYRQSVLDFMQAATGEWRDFKTRTRDGRVLDTCWANIRLSDGSTIGIGQDITQRKLSEETIYRCQEEFRALVENSPDIVARFDRELRHVYVNPAVEITTGIPAQTFIGKTNHDLGMPDTCISLWQDTLQEVFQTGEERIIEFDFPTTDGVQFFQSRVVPEFGKDGTINSILSVAREITALKQTEEALRHSEERFRTIFENAGIGIAVANREGELIQANPALQKMLGYSGKELLQMHYTNLTYPEDLEKEQLLVQDCLQGKIGGYSLEKRYLHKDDRVIWVELTLSLIRDKAGQIKLAVGMIEDITQRKLSEEELHQTHLSLEQRATQLAAANQQLQTTLAELRTTEANLRESEQRWRSLLENVNLVVVGLNFEGKVEYVNPFFLALSGYSQAEVLGNDWCANFIVPQQRQLVGKIIEEELEQELHSHYQNSLLTKSGQEKVIAWNNTVLHNLQGDVIGTMSIGEDITERQALERIKDEFISVVSHELRTPLTSINGALKLLSKGLVPPQSEKGRRAINIAADSCEGLVRLVNDILVLERLESGQISLLKQWVNAADLAIKATGMMQLAADQAGVSISVVSPTIQLDVDADRIIQVLTNLLSNAIKFSPTGSKICLTAEALDDSEAGSQNQRDPNLENNTHSTEAKGVLFKVKDQGRGIPAEKTESIFERFNQVDGSDSRQKGGTGLGLAICHSIVQQHGGKIWVESTVNKGSTFYVMLPVKSM
ncbi:MAG: PAS domain S-box protein [Coleofasciculaceae cyanobacterium]